MSGAARIEREVQEILRERRGASRLMDYGPDWPPKPEPVRDRYWRLVWYRFRVSLALLLVALAAGTIVYDHLAHPGALTPPSRGHAVDVTTTLPPDPATTSGHP